MIRQQSTGIHELLLLSLCRKNYFEDGNSKYFPNSEQDFSFKYLFKCYASSGLLVPYIIDKW